MEEQAKRGMSFGSQVQEGRPGMAIGAGTDAGDVLCLLDSVGFILK